MSILARSNDALNINPPVGTHHLSVSGSDWLWAVTAVYLFSLIIVVPLAYRAKAGERIFHYLFTISLLTGGIAYFTVASDLGNVAVQVSDNVGSSPGTRQIFYAKYINWFVGWTPLVIAVGLISGVSWATIIYNIALTWIWVASWLASAFTPTTYKWGFFTFGLFAYFLLAASILHHGLISATRVGLRPHYTIISGWLVFLWFLYPIAFGLDDGGNEISVRSGFIFFGILDLFTVPLLSFVFLFLSTRWDYGALNLHFTQYGRVNTVAGTFPEKGGVVEPAPAAAPAAAPAVAPEQAV